MSKYVHPHARPELIDKTEEHVRSILSQKEVEAYLSPYPHPEINGYLLDNAGQDGTPVRVRVLHGYVHEPDGTPRGPGDLMIMPKYVADPWIEEERLELA